jgi:hypothetical protein
VPPATDPYGPSSLSPHFQSVVDPGGQWWGGVEYLLWWVSPGRVSAPLVSTGSPADLVTGVPGTFPGTLGLKTTTVLFGPGNEFDYGATSGARMTLGYWFDCQGSVGIEGRGFVMEQRTSTHTFSANGSGAPVIATPFFNTALGIEDANDIAFPGLFTGLISVASTTQLYGFEVNIVSNLLRSECWNISALGGFRFAGLDESVTRFDATTPSPGNVDFYLNTAFPPPAVTTTTDLFQTHNHFYGGQLGGTVQRNFGKTFFAVSGRVALGDVHEEVHNSGVSALFVGPVGPVSQHGGGLLVLDANTGRFERDTFAVIPEVELKIGYQFNCHCSAYVGYTFMYWSDVVRPGDQIDHLVNANRVPTFAEFNQPGGGPFPRALFNSTDYWAHGVSFGVEFKF